MVSQHLRFPAVSLAVAWILPCWAATVVASVPGNAQTNEILSVSVAAEARDTVTFDVVYRYSGDHGNNVFMSVMAQDREASDHFGYRLGRVQAGRQRTRVELSANAGAPRVFSTNQIEVGMSVGGRELFIKRTFAFQKTWSKAGATLPLAVSDGGSSSGRGTGSGGIVRRVLPGGQIELRYPDGTIRQRYAGGETIIRPDGTQRTLAFQMAQPPTPPSSPPDATHAAWLSAENERLFDIIQTLVGNDEPSLQQYLAHEGSNMSLYRKVDSRTQAIQWLLSP